MQRGDEEEEKKGVGDSRRGRNYRENREERERRKRRKEGRSKREFRGVRMRGRAGSDANHLSCEEHVAAA